MDADFRKVTIASACAFNIGMLSWWAQPIIVQSVIAGLSLSEKQAGLVIAAEIMAIALSSLVISRQLHRLEMKNTCLVASLLAVACHALSIYADNYPVLLAIRMLAGIGEGLVYAIAVGAIAATINPDRGYGIINAGNIVFCSIFIALVPGIESSTPHVVTFASLAIVSAILLPFVLYLPASMPLARSDAAGLVPLPGRDVRAWRLMLAMFLWGTGINTLWPCLFLIGTDTSLSVDQVGVALGSSGIAALSGIALMAGIGSRFGRYRPLLAGLAVNLGAVLLITMSNGAIGYLLGVNLLMMAVYYLLPLILAMSAEMDPAGRMAAAAGGMYMFTGGIGPVIGGYLLSEFGPVSIGYLFVVECVLVTCLFWRLSPVRLPAGAAPN